MQKTENYAVNPLRTVPDNKHTYGINDRGPEQPLKSRNGAKAIKNVEYKQASTDQVYRQPEE